MSLTVHTWRTVKVEQKRKPRESNNIGRRIQRVCKHVPYGLPEGNRTLSRSFSTFPASWRLLNDLGNHNPMVAENPNVESTTNVLRLRVDCLIVVASFCDSTFINLDLAFFPGVSVSRWFNIYRWVFACLHLSKLKKMLLFSPSKHVFLHCFPFQWINPLDELLCLSICLLYTSDAADE